MSAPAAALPLAGMRVLDLTRALAGPFCTMILADLGADVIKVEPSPAGDMSRAWGPFDHGESVYYLSANRNKRAIGVEFRTDVGRALLRRMALASDVVVENFKPGTLKAIGLDPAALRGEKPDLIVASISGFGPDGPLGDRPGFDQIAQGYSGLMSITGMPGAPPTRVGTAIGDLTAGMWTVIGILAAWIERGRTGQGQAVETSLLGSLIGLLSVQGQRYLSVGEVPGPSGSAHPVIAPYGVFRAGDGDLNIGAATQEMWLRLCDIIGAPELKSDPRFRDNAGRMTNRDALERLIDEKLASGSRHHWTELLVAAGIPAGPINDMEGVFAEPQVAHARLVETVEHPDIGPLRQVVSPVGLAALAGRCVRSAPPRFGEHTDAVLKEFGLSAAEIEDLRLGKAIA
ncbi:CoA transferase [Xanthobacter sp. KR7-225]|uniref:CaiB/BaiF CoA transferase family protein n=1 Tax=Xanthobacter sp. KR7-225 TaxID=3156613 RepID=UPI0032B50EA0